MKLTKKLLPALGMLALSACMLITSTFAWFSMNTQVSATNMQVTAVTDQVFLQIVKKGDTFTNGTVQSEAAAADNDAKYSAVNVYADDQATAYTGGKSFVWLTTTSANPAVADKNANSDWTVANPDTYTYKTQYELRLDPTAGSNNGGKLKVTSVTFAEGTDTDPDISAAVAVLIVCEEDNLSMLYTQATAGTFTKKAGDTALTTGNFPASTTSQNNIKTVTVYVFFDGSNAACTTNNATAADGATFAVNVTFNVNADA